MLVLCTCLFSTLLLSITGESHCDDQNHYKDTGSCSDQVSISNTNKKSTDEDYVVLATHKQEHSLDEENFSSKLDSWLTISKKYILSPLVIAGAILSVIPIVVKRWTDYRFKIMEIRREHVETANRASRDKELDALLDLWGLYCSLSELVKKHAELEDSERARIDIEKDVNQKQCEIEFRWLESHPLLSQEAHKAHKEIMAAASNVITGEMACEKFQELLLKASNTISAQLGIYREKI